MASAAGNGASLVVGVSISGLEGQIRERDKPKRKSVWVISWVTASAEYLRAQASSRPVTYLLGDSDILPSGVFDVSCPAMAQGPTRLARGLAYAKYMNDNFGAHHRTAIVPFCGHSARCLFTSDVALPIIFPR